MAFLFMTCYTVNVKKPDSSFFSKSLLVRLLSWLLLMDYKYPLGTMEKGEMIVKINNLNEI